MTNTFERTPAEELRAAAEKLRTIGGAAMCRQPWTAESLVTSCGQWVVGDDGDPVAYASHTWTGTGDEDGYVGNDQIAAWIALAHPALTEPLAAWLESAALHAARVTDPRNQEIISDSHALAVARVINGGAS